MKASVWLAVRILLRILYSQLTLTRWVAHEMHGS